MRRTTALIIGGGPAGSAAAITLARGGAQPLLIERNGTPQDALCGGFMSWQTLASLRELGIGETQLGGHPINRVALFSGKKKVEAKLPAEGMGLSRLKLDSEMLNHAEAMGVAVERGQAVREARYSDAHNTSVRKADGTEIAAEALFLATGKHDVRGAKRPAPSEPDPWMGLRFRIGASPQLQSVLDGAIELHLFAKGYAGLLLQEDGSANLCMALRQSRLAAAGGDPAVLLAELREESCSLANRLENETLPEASDAIGLVPYGWRAEAGLHGLFRIGDQAAVIPSLAGEGVGIAIASARAAGRAFLEGGPSAASAFQLDFAKQAKRPLAVAGTFKALIDRPRLARTALHFAKLPGVMSLASRLTRIA